jgi:phospholipase/lecithinase/hemolysin
MERQLPAFTKAHQNKAVVAALLHALLTPFIDGMGEGYQQLKSILDATPMQQAKSSLLHQVEASILTPPAPRAGNRGPSKEL